MSHACFFTFLASIVSLTVVQTLQHQLKECLHPILLVKDVVIEDRETKSLKTEIPIKGLGLVPFSVASGSFLSSFWVSVFPSVSSTSQQQQKSVQ